MRPAPFSGPVRTTATLSFWRLLKVLAVTLLLLSPDAARLARAAAQPTARSASWSWLGPPGPRPVVALAAAPDAPSLLLVARTDGLLLTRDGGDTWQRLPSPPALLRPESTSLTLTSALHDGQRLALLLARDRGGDGADLWKLFRAADPFDTWAEALALPGREAPALRLSPGFPHDGLALLLADGALWLTRDAAATWEILDPVPGQRVSDALFSPTFAVDGTMLAALVSGPFPSFTTDAPHAQSADDHLASAGVLRSLDLGATWEPAGDPPLLDGVFYRHVRGLFASPTYERDATLLAFAWGPRDPLPFQAAQARALSHALFRSRDGGQTWEPIRHAGPAFSRASVRLALSPTFDTDGLILLAVNDGGLSPASFGCSVLRSADGGDSWDLVVRPGSYEGCGDLTLVGASDTFLAVVRKGAGWLRSDDGGQTWAGLDVPESRATVVAAAPPALLVGAESGGVWRLAPVPPSNDAAAHLPCDHALQLGFARVWSAVAWVRRHLGCPLAPERTTLVREALLPERHLLAVGDLPGAWFDLRPGHLLRHESAREPFPTNANAYATPGSVQPFEGGLLVWLPRPDGSRAILALAAHDWRAFSD